LSGEVRLIGGLDSTEASSWPVTGSFTAPGGGWMSLSRELCSVAGSDTKEASFWSTAGLFTALRGWWMSNCKRSKIHRARWICHVQNLQI